MGLYLNALIARTNRGLNAVQRDVVLECVNTLACCQVELEGTYEVDECWDLIEQDPYKVCAIDADGAVLLCGEVCVQLVENEEDVRIDTIRNLLLSDVYMVLSVHTMSGYGAFALWSGARKVRSWASDEDGWGTELPEELLFSSGGSDRVLGATSIVLRRPLLECPLWEWTGELYRTLESSF